MTAEPRWGDRRTVSFARAGVAGGGLLLLAVLVALPWTAPEAVRLALPLSVVALVHRVTWSAPGRLPLWAVVVAGLAVDAVSHAPLGLWALVNLTALGVSVATRPAHAVGYLGRLLGFVPVVVSAVGAEWALASIYDAVPLDWRGQAAAAALVLGLYGALDPLATRLQARAARRRILILERGG